MTLFYDEEIAARNTAADHGAEAAVVGACLVDGTLLDEIRLNPTDFDNLRLGAIWATLQEIHADGRPTDPTAVVSALMDAGHLAKVGGGEYVSGLYGDAPAPQSATWHALRVAEMARRRALNAFAAGITQVVSTPMDADDMLAEVRRRLDRIDDVDDDQGPTHWAQVVEEGMEAIEAAGNGGEVRGIPTGLADLDAVLQGLRPGDIIIIGGRPGTGKSTLAMQIAAHAGIDLKYPTLALSLEMRKPELYNRIVSSRLGIPLGNLNLGTLDDTAWSKIAIQAGGSADSPFWIEDNPNQSLASISALARKWKRRHGLRLLVIDYLQLITVNPAENRQAAISELSRGLKILAGQVDVPIVLAAQLNRNSEGRAKKVPQLGDLRESGSLENDASIVVLVHREEASDPDTIRQGEADLIVAKNRNGAQATVEVAAQLHLARFASMAGRDFTGGR